MLELSCKDIYFYNKNYKFVQNIENMSLRYVILLAGGSGTRMKSADPKQFILLNNKSLLQRCIETFTSLSFKVEVVLVMEEKSIERWKDYCRESQLFIPHRLVSGGMTRYHSVKNALKHIPLNSIVAVHDVARPFIRKEDIERLYQEAEEKGAVIPLVKVVDSLRKVEDDHNSHSVDRDGIYLVQTPQVFNSEILLHSYTQPFSVKFTDDASVIESAGYTISTSQGNPLNIKLTSQDDIALAELIAKDIDQKEREEREKKKVLIS